MFKDNGELFYPAFPGDPFYADFITGEGLMLPAGPLPRRRTDGLAEFFGDHMVVNGKIWPKMDVEPRNYRLRLLNGCDSRFLAVQFCESAGWRQRTSTMRADRRCRSTVIGSDQGSGCQPDRRSTPCCRRPARRYDIVFDFTT